MREDHGVVLGIGLVTSRPGPLLVGGQLWVKPPGKQGVLASCGRRRRPTLENNTE